MRVLLVHNKYQHAGGEDTVFNEEAALLEKHGNVVERLVFDNRDIRTSFDQLLTGLFMIYNPKSAKAARKKIQEFQPDIIHVHNFFPLASPAIFFVAEKFRIPVVMTLHNFRMLCPSATLYYDNKIYERSIGRTFPIHAIVRGVYRNSRVQTFALVLMMAVHKWMKTWSKRVTRYIVLTEFAKSKFQQGKLGIAPEQMMIKPNFVQDFGLGSAEREDFFLYVGRLSEEKGIRILLEACENADFAVTIIGDGPLRSLVEERAASNPMIRYVGFQNRTAVINTMKRCKALIFPSVCYETFGMSIIEAFATGTPVIASKHGAMAELVEDGRTGLHFEPGNAADLKEKIRLLLEQPGLARELSANARVSYTTLYSPEKNYEQLIGLYRSLTQNAGN
jgi:glycosyltransferase involved in cell wall biosynthesis